MNSNFSLIVAMPFGGVGVVCDSDHVDEIVFLPPGSIELPAQNALAAEVARQMQRYLSDAASVFNLPLRSKGTVFQCRVWQAIGAIPVGSVRSYGDIARSLGSAARAVGQACGANPYPIVVPCHRVAAQKNLGGFAHARDGWLMAAKRWLLTHEGVL